MPQRQRAFQANFTVSIFAAAAVIATLGVPADAPAQVTQRQEDRRDDALRRHMSPALAERLADYANSLEVTGPARLGALVVLLARNGMLRVSDGDVVTRSNLVSLALQRAEPPLCATYGRGVDDVSDELFALLDDNQFDILVSFQVQAMAAELEGYPSAREIDETEVWPLIEELLPDESFDLLWYALVEGERVADEVACWATRTLYELSASFPRDGAMLGRFLNGPGD